MGIRPAIRRSLGDKAPFLAVLTVSSALSVALFGLRVLYSGSEIYLFLVWNLFLAWIPFLCALTLWWLDLPRSRIAVLAIPLLAGWLLFFPNALYIISDLIHLTQRGRVPVWYDALVLFSFAWNGLMLGLASLWIVQSVIDHWFGRVASWLWVGASISLTGFGVYLGRFLRWNSWDILTEPGALFSDIAERVLNPAQHPQAIVFTVVFSSFLSMAYLTISAMLATRWERPSS